MVSKTYITGRATFQVEGQASCASGFFYPIELLFEILWDPRVLLMPTMLANSLLVRIESTNAPCETPFANLASQEL
jgi:hypothetical protein